MRRHEVSAYAALALSVLTLGGPAVKAAIAERTAESAGAGVLPDPIAVVDQEHQNMLAQNPGFTDDTYPGYYSKEVPRMIREGITNGDKVTKTQLKPNKIGGFSVTLWQQNARVQVVAASLKDPNDVMGKTYATESVYFDDDMFSSKTVRLTPMVVKKNHGHFKLVQWGKSVKLKKWEDLSPTNLIKTTTDDHLAPEPLHTTVGKVRFKKLSPAQKAEGSMYVAVNQSCISRYAGNKACQEILNTAYRIGGKTEAGSAKARPVTYGVGGFALGSVINVVTSSHGEKSSYAKSFPVKSFYFPRTAKRSASRAR